MGDRGMFADATTTKIDATDSGIVVPSTTSRTASLGANRTGAGNDADTTAKTDASESTSVASSAATSTITSNGTGRRNSTLEVSASDGAIRVVAPLTSTVAMAVAVYVGTSS